MDDQANICGICGGMSKGILTDPFVDGLNELADCLINRRFKMVCGGVNSGLIGCFINAVLQKNGWIEGAIVDEELQDAHLKLKHMQHFSTFDARKSYLFDQSQLIVFLPGGFGTFDEVFTLLIENKIGVRSIPLLLWNSQNFWNPIQDLIETALRYQFFEKRDTNCLMISDNLKDINQWLNNLFL